MEVTQMGSRTEGKVRLHMATVAIAAVLAASFAGVPFWFSDRRASWQLGGAVVLLAYAVGSIPYIGTAPRRVAHQSWSWPAIQCLVVSIGATGMAYAHCIASIDPVDTPKAFSRNGWIGLVAMAVLAQIIAGMLRFLAGRVGEGCCQSGDIAVGGHPAVGGHHTH
ncbi:MAG: hypothetical protein HYU66_05450 [Armatimonadetes bacterium]|nr:hypothetical protein [Armatimonadota bacterium]